MSEEVRTCRIRRGANLPCPKGCEGIMSERVPTYRNRRGANVLSPKGVPDPRRPQFPVHITASLSSQSTRSQTQEEDAFDVLSAHQQSDAKPSDPDQTRLASARDRSCSSHLVFIRGSLGGPGSTICKTKVILNSENMNRT
ncbi:hypothetical protein F2Q68_00044639 [Brassica cretica]|uniref:Uncharacterized protein n=1 Tax=Brassica cretica TaxID=69181 RepID=A0A8S9LIC8_BRACR|nr:hypothetical protein F2Q68_00044639 [Brassica cretica]